MSAIAVVDHAVIRDGIRNLLGKIADVEVIANANLYSRPGAEPNDLADPGVFRGGALIDTACSSESRRVT